MQNKREGKVREIFKKNKKERGKKERISHSIKDGNSFFINEREQMKKKKRGEVKKLLPFFVRLIKPLPYNFTLCGFAIAIRLITVCMRLAKKRRNERGKKDSADNKGR